MHVFLRIIVISNLPTTSRPSARTAQPARTWLRIIMASSLPLLTFILLTVHFALTNSQTCSYYTDLRMNGNTMPGGGSQPSIRACCETCNSFLDCAVWNFRPNINGNGTCTLYSYRINTSSEPGTFCGFRSADLTTHTASPTTTTAYTTTDNPTTPPIDSFCPPMGNYTLPHECMYAIIICMLKVNFKICI